MNYIYGIILVSLLIYCLYDLYHLDLSTDKKMIWLAVVLIFPFFGAIAYLIFSKT